MKKIVFISFLLLTTLASCKKDSTPDYLAIDIEKITTYLEEKGLEAQRLESGLFYIIEIPGSEQKPVSSSTVTVSYKGSLLNGDVFDEGSFFTAPLNNLIEGWIQGIPLVGAGGKIKLFIPSPLAYGSNATGSIPANSPLIFEVRLHYFSE